MVMGFSPTVWKSSSRTYLFLLFAVLIVSAVILHDFYERYTARQRETVGWLLGIGWAAVFISGLMLMH